MRSRTPTRPPLGEPAPRRAAIAVWTSALWLSAGCSTNAGPSDHPPEPHTGGVAGNASTAAAASASGDAAAPAREPPASGAGSPSPALQPSASDAAAPPAPDATGAPMGTASLPVNTPSAPSPTSPPLAMPVAPTGACALSPERIRITEVDVGSRVDTNEEEARLRPLVISALAKGGSRLAWMSDDGHLHVTTLGPDDTAAGQEVRLPARDFSDLLADDAGGVALLTRDAQGTGERHCGELSNLCGNSDELPAQYSCLDMYMVRFDGQDETWAAQLTESGAEAPPYLSSPDDSARRVYIWEAYAHHGRLATNGTDYAGYYGAAISVSETCVQPDSSKSTGVNIHQGDRLDVVSPTGERRADGGGFAWGCSHSGYERLTWDPTAKRWIALCKTDNSNRLALAPNYVTIRPVDLAANNVSDVVLRADGGYWLASSDVEPSGGGLADVSLLGFAFSGDQVAVDHELTVAGQAGLNERAPYLAQYGTDGLLVGFETGAQSDDLRATDTERRLFLQVLSASTGAAIGDAIEVPVPGNRYQSFRSFPDGSVAFPARGTTDRSIRVLRVLPCTP